MAVEHDRHKLFLKLLLDHQAKVHAYVLSLVTNYTDADDILQEVSQLLWQRFDEFQPGTNILSWALRFAYFEAINFRKWRAKSKEMVFDDKTLAQILPVLEDERNTRMSVLMRWSIAWGNRKSIAVRLSKCATTWICALRRSVCVWGIRLQMCIEGFHAFTAGC